MIGSSSFDIARGSFTRWSRAGFDFFSSENEGFFGWMMTTVWGFRSGQRTRDSWNNTRRKLN